MGFYYFKTMKLSSLVILSFIFSIFTLNSHVKLKILGIAQDGGVPHAGCNKECCAEHFKNNTGYNVVSLGLTDESTNQNWLFEATPDITEQLKELCSNNENLSGIFITHAHIGHYTGLMYFGREVMGSEGINVFAMPRMSKFLENSGPWSQLVELNNIRIMNFRIRK